MRKYIFLFFAFSILLSACGGKGLKKEKTDEDIYNEGVALFNDEDFKESIEVLREIVDRHPSSPFEPKAEIMIADAYFLNEQYMEAIDVYATFIKFHPSSDLIPHAYYRTAYSYYKQLSTIDRDQDATKKAYENFKKVVDNYPSSPYQDDARKKMTETWKMLGERELYVGRYYVRVEKYSSAIPRLIKVIEDFKDIGITDEALFYLARAYQGLGEKEKAKDTYDRLIKNYPDSRFFEDSVKNSGAIN